MKINKTKRILFERGITQEQLMNETNWSKTEISYVLNYKRDTPLIQEDIARFVGIDVDALFGRMSHRKIRERRIKKELKETAIVPPCGKVNN